MKKQLNFWSINFFLTVVTSFLLNGGVFAGNTGGLSLSKGRMGTIKLSGKNSAIHVKGTRLIVRHPFRKHLGQDNRNSTRQKGKR